jgi:hypothetical protein
MSRPAAKRLAEFACILVDRNGGPALVTGPSHRHHRIVRDGKLGPYE